MLMDFISADNLESMFADVLLLIGFRVVFDEHVKSLNKFSQQKHEKSKKQSLL